MSQGEERYHHERARIEQGHVKYRDKLRAEGKLFVRDRLKLLLDPGTQLQEEWLFARNQENDTPAVMPDKRIDLNWSVYKAGRDPVMEWIRSFHANR